MSEPGIRTHTALAHPSRESATTSLLLRASPYTSVVSHLASSSLGQRGNWKLRRFSTSGAPRPSRECALRSRQLRCTPRAMPEICQVDSGIGGGRCDRRAPVDTYTFRALRSGEFDGPTRNERGIPMTERIPIHPNGSRLTGRLAASHDGERATFGRNQSSISIDTEAAGGISQRRKSLLPGLDYWTSPSPDPGRVVQSVPVGTKHLLLSPLRTSAQPRIPSACDCQQHAQLLDRGVLDRTLLVDSLIQQEPASTPLRFQRSGRQLTRPEPKAVPHGLPHPHTAEQDSDMLSRLLLPDRNRSTSLIGGQR